MAKESIDKAQLKWHAEDLEDLQFISISGEHTLLPNDRLERLRNASKFIVSAIKDGDLVLIGSETLIRMREIREALGNTSNMRGILDHVMKELSEINEIDVTTVSDALEGLLKIDGFLEEIDLSDE